MEFHASQGHYIKALEERPTIELGNEWFWQAFNRLSTTRQVGMGKGPISYLDTMEYADRMGMDSWQKELLWDVLKKLDNLYLTLTAPKPPPKPASRR